MPTGENSSGLHVMDKMELKDFLLSGNTHTHHTVIFQENETFPKHWVLFR